MSSTLFDVSFVFSLSLFCFSHFSSRRYHCCLLPFSQLHGCLDKLAADSRADVSRLRFCFTVARFFVSSIQISMCEQNHSHVIVLSAANLNERKCFLLHLLFLSSLCCAYLSISRIVFILGIGTKPIGSTEYNRDFSVWMRVWVYFCQIENGKFSQWYSLNFFLFSFTK